MALSGVAAGLSGSTAQGRASREEAASAEGTIPPDKLRLKDYRPKSIYKIPETRIAKAKYPVIDCHTHPYARTPAQVNQWVQNMDAVGLEKGIILTQATGEKFDEIRRLYSPHTDRFDLWCGFDLSRFNSAGFEERALKELERCHELGAKGVGELVDKGRGIGAPIGTEPRSWEVLARGPRPHPGDPKLDALFERCGQLGMPVSIHVSDPA